MLPEVIAMPSRSGRKQPSSKVPRSPGCAPGTNQVVLTGRVSSGPTVKDLPSGDQIVTFRLSVGRQRTAMTTRSRAAADSVDCTAWTVRLRHTVARWQVGDRVEVHGALRRRFYAAGGTTTTRLEVEVLRGRAVAAHDGSP